MGGKAGRSPASLGFQEAGGVAGGLGALDAAMGGGAGGMKIVSNSRVLIGVVSSFKATRILVQESGGLKSWLHCWGAVDSGS